MRDIKFYKTDEDHEGDLQLTPDGDLQLCSGLDEERQMAMNRIKTNNPDWSHHLEIGSDLEDLRGRVQAQETANLGAQKIIDSLTYDGRFSAENIRVEPVPTDMDEITYFIFISNDYSTEELLIEYPVQL